MKECGDDVTGVGAFCVASATGDALGGYVSYGRNCSKNVRKEGFFVHGFAVFLYFCRKFVR